VRIEDVPVLGELGRNAVAGALQLGLHAGEGLPQALHPGLGLRPRAGRGGGGPGGGAGLGARGGAQGGAGLRCDGRSRGQSGDARLGPYVGEAGADAFCRGGLRGRVLASCARTKKRLLKKAARLGAHPMHRREAHSAALVHVHVKRDRLEGALTHAAYVLDEVLRGHSLGARLLHDRSLRPDGHAAVLRGELDSEGTADPCDHAYRHAPLARNIPCGCVRCGVHGKARAYHPHRGPHGHGSRGAAGDGLACGGIAVGEDGQELGRIVERTELEEVPLPHRCRQVQAHIGTREPARTRTTAVATTTTDEGVLELMRRDDIAHQLSAVVGTLVAHHAVIGRPEEVGVGEVAVEGTPELPVTHGVRRTVLVAWCERLEGATIGRDHRVHVVRGLHAPLHLERAHARIPHLGEVIHGAVVLGAERSRTTGRRDHPSRLVHEVVRKAAGLRTQAAVCRATAGERAHHADARVAEAQRPMPKALQLDALLGDAGDLGQRELARERHAIHA